MVENLFAANENVTTEAISWNESISETNHSIVTEFFFLGLSNTQELQIFLFVFFFVFDVATVFGNLLIVITVASDSYLHTPMCFLLANLSFIDLCLSSVTAPKVIPDFFRKCKVISFTACLAQVFLLHFFGGGELVILMATAFDRYVAICQPLCYTTIMCDSVCVLALWLLHSTSQLAFAVNLPFCGPNEVDSFYCDLPKFIRLACTDTYRLDIMVIANSGVLLVCSFVLLIVSHTVILVTIQHLPSQRSSKALSTLTAHITVVLLFFVPCIFIYAWPFSIKSLDKFLVVFCSVVTPLLNPTIYTLRNKDMKTTRRLRKWNMNSRIKFTKDICEPLFRYRGRMFQKLRLALLTPYPDTENNARSHAAESLQCVRVCEVRVETALWVGTHM
ncbi:olfactory receptor 4F4-like [Hippopotamus amphibius kiboko]|uniref:olfactory receptor 4F4-like n=1 Tax=Hippopotamus amphibius kiboko TaxID=575201 RepID=UPI0025963C0D|nr:olfactory receptor 4F4-like [Hippopotamus amphibius kiboko]